MTLLMMELEEFILEHESYKNLEAEQLWNWIYKPEQKSEL